MGVPRTGRRRPVARALAVLTGVAALWGVLAPPAAGADPVVDPSARGSVTVVKTDGSGRPVAGAEFTAHRIDGIDVTTNAGQVRATDLAGRYVEASPRRAADAEAFFAAQGVRLIEERSGQSGPTGEVSLRGLPLGAYLVTERSTVGSSPFVVTVPTTADGGSTWTYDVVVQPKGDPPGAASKSVSDGAATGVAGVVEWTVYAGLPVPGPDAFRIVDQLDARLDLLDVRVSLVPTHGPAVPLVAGVDFSLTPAGPAKGGSEVVVDFAGPQLAPLVANAGGQVVVVLRTTVAQPTTASSVVTNRAAVYENQAAISAGDPFWTNDVATHWGGITIQKVDDAARPLPGARFAVYTTPTGGSPIPFGPDRRVIQEVDAAGRLTLPNLRLSAYADGNPVALSPGDDGFITYYLDEVEAPEGFSRLATRIPFVVDHDDADPGRGAIDGVAPVELPVQNLRARGSLELPRLGGTGLVLAYVAGVLLVGGVLVGVVRVARRTHATG